MNRDPLDDDYHGVCSCEGGWIAVPPSYAEHLHPLPPQPALGSTTEVLVAHHLRVESITLRRASATNSVYPCKRCRPEQFDRWAGGHFDAKHDPHRCDECSEAAGTPRRTRRATSAARPVGEPPPEYDERPRYAE